MAALWPSVKDRFDTNSKNNKLSFMFLLFGNTKGVQKKGPDFYVQSGVFRGMGRLGEKGCAWGTLIKILIWGAKVVFMGGWL